MANRASTLEIETKELSPAAKKALATFQEMSKGVFATSGNGVGIKIADVEVGLSASLEDDAVLTGAIPQITLLAIAQDILNGTSLPPEIPDISFSDSVLSITPATNTFSLQGTSTTDWDFNTGGPSIETEVDFSFTRTSSDAGADIIDCTLTLTGEGHLKVAPEVVFKQFDLAFELENSTDWSLSGEIVATLFKQKLKLAAGYSHLDTVKMLTLSTKAAAKTGISLTAITEGLLNGVTLPAELPKVKFSNLAIVIASTGTFSFEGQSTVGWNFNTQGTPIATKVGLSLKRTVSAIGTNLIDCDIVLNATAPLKVADELVFKQFDLDFKLRNSQDWLLSGAVTTELFGQSFILAASYAQTEETKTLCLKTTKTTSKALVSITGVGGLNASELAMSLSKTADRYAWQVSASGQVWVDNVFDFGGTLSLSHDDTTTSLSFLPTLATVNLPLAVSSYQGRQASMDLGVGPISIVRTAGVGSADADWAFAAETTLALKGLPAEIQKLLPEKMTAQFKADTDAVSLSVDRVLEPIALPIPDIEIDSNTRISLGTAALDASNLSIRFDSSAVELSAELGLGLPAELNKAFGVKADGSPAMNLFRVYNAADPNNSIVKIKLSVGTEGIKLTPASSPIEAIKFLEESGTMWCNCNFGEFGEIRFQVPSFSLDATTGSFTAKGGFETVRPLQLPLTPFKTLLTATDMKDVANALPDSLPLQAISILDEQNNFNVRELNTLFEQTTGAALPPVVKESFTTIANRADQLPDQFKHYLNIEIPTSFRFDIAVTPDGSARIDVGVKEGDPPLKFLYVVTSPAFDPVFIGAELRSFSFGEILGGSLFLMEVDARIDQFDIFTLAASLLLPQGDVLPLPASRDLHRRLIIDKLFMLIVYQTAVPIPIPLFFDELGVEYLGFEGVGLQSHVSFPQPKINLMDLGEMLAKIKPFFADRSYLLDPNDRPEGMDVVFSLGKNYIQLPEYLGHQVAGSKNELLNISAYEYTAKLLNGLKTLSLNSLIQALPISHRVGFSDISLGSLTTTASWLLTTPDEFRQIATQRFSIPTNEISDALAVLPPSGDSRNEQGLVTFLRGSWDIEEVASFDAMFGLVASGSMGFQTGFKITGTIANFMDMEMSGRVAINAPKPDRFSAIIPSSQSAEKVFQLEGHSHLVISGREIFLGDVDVTDDRFDLSGRFDLFPPEFPLQATGKLVGHLSKDALYLAGDITTQLGDITLVEARGVISNHRIALQGKWLGVSTEIEVEQREGALALRGEAALDLFGLQAAVMLTSDRNGVTAVQGTIAPIDLGFFKLAGTGVQSRPSFNLQLQAGNVSKMSISSTVELLGFRQATQLEMSETGFSFRTNAKLFDKFEASLMVTGNRLGDRNGFHVVAELQNDLLQALKRETTNIITQVAAAASAELMKAQQAVVTAQKEVNTLNSNIAYQRGIVTQERAAAQNIVKDLEQKVNTLRGPVNSLTQQIRYKENEWSRLDKDKHHAWPRIGVWLHNDPARLLVVAGELTGLRTAYGTANQVLQKALTGLDYARGALMLIPTLILGLHRCLSLVRQPL